MTWAYIRRGSFPTYPPGWALSYAKVCLSLTHSTGLSGIVSARLKYASYVLNPLIKDMGGAATAITDACFSDAALDIFPSDAAGEPFTGECGAAPP